MPKIEPFVVPGPQSQWRFNADFLTLLEDVKLYAPLSLYYVWDRHLGDLFADPDVEAIERMLHALQHHLAKTRRIGDWERIFLGMTLLMLEAPYIQTASPNKTKVVQLIIDPARKQLEIEGVDTPRVWGALLDAAFGVLSRTRPGQSAFYAIARAMFRYGPDPQVEDVKHTLATLAPDSYPKQAEAKGDHPFRRFLEQRTPGRHSAPRMKTNPHLFLTVIQRLRVLLGGTPYRFSYRWLAVLAVAIVAICAGLVQLRRDRQATESIRRFEREWVTPLEAAMKVER